MKNKIIKYTMVALICLSNTLGVYANSLSDSTGSNASDLSVGADTTQGKYTEYVDTEVDSTTYEYSSSVNMYATKASIVQYSIPQTIIGDAQSGEASYQVGVKGDIDSYQVISIEVPEKFELSDGVRSFSASIEQEKSKWVWDELDVNSFNVSVGHIYFDIPAGSFVGNFNFTISITREVPSTN